MNDHVNVLLLGVPAMVCFVTGTVSNSLILSYFLSKKEDR